jgi:hypothetical protein
MLKKSLTKSHIDYFCNFCNYNTNKKNDYEKHIMTAKHQLLTSSNGFVSKFSCDKCNKKYNSRVGLWSHKKKCLNKIIINEINKDPNDYSKGFIINIIKENQEIKNLLIEQNKQVLELQKQQNKQVLELQKENTTLMNKMVEFSQIPTQIINTTNNNNNTTNQSFNLNVFLNETCKDAMNVKEFLDNLNPTLDDLENVGEKGFVKGISDIILRSLREIEINKRPIHCTDIKREVVYLKEDNIWNKDDKDNSKMKEFIRKVENKNFNNVLEWQRNHPNVMILDSPDYIKRDKLIERSCEAVNNEDRVRGKVLKELLKEIHINDK